MATPVLNTFNSGELSDYLSARTDLSKYRNGCDTLENMLVLPYGGVERRPGTEFIAEVKDSSDITRLIPFERSEDTSFVLEFGDYYIRFYTNGGQVEVSSAPAWVTSTSYVVGDYVTESTIIYYCQEDHTSGTFATDLAAGKWVAQTIYEIPSPYAEDEVWDLKFAQSADVMYFVHPLYPPHKLSRIGQAEWTLVEIDFTYAALKDANIEATPTITATLISGDSYTLTASSALFDADDVNGHYLLKFPRNDNAIQEVFTSATVGSSTLSVFGDWNFTTHGTWTGTVQIQRSFNGGTTWSTYRTYSGTDDRNVEATGTEELENVLYRIECTAYTSGTITCDLDVEEYFDNVLHKITAFASSTSVTATRLSGTAHVAEATSDWAEGSWSPKNGYPETIAFYEERLVFGATSAQPQTVWTSKIGDYENLTSGTLDDSALIYTISSDRVNKILWMVPQTSLMIGTDGGEWKMWSGKRDEPLTPTNVSFKRQSTYGSESTQAILINDVIMYIQRGARKLREMSYSYEREVYVSPDMSILAEHVTETGIVDMVFQQNPHPIVWFTRTDGQLIGFTYEAGQEVVGWHRHPMDNGEVESLTTISGLPEDELWMVVKRTIDGNDVRYVERLKPIRFGSTNLDSWFVDSALEFDGGAAVAITGATNADPCVISAPGHSFLDGQQVRITGVVGMTELNTHIFTVSNPGAGTLELRDVNDTGDIDSTNYGTYVSGGELLRVENTFAGLEHLEGETVAALVDGAVVDDTTVSSGTAVLEAFGNKIVIGLSYVSILKPMNIESDLADGGSQARKKRISQVDVRFYKTTGAKLVNDEGDEMVIPFRKPSDPMSRALPLFSGDKKLFYKDGFDISAGITVKQELALPMTVLMISPWIKNFN